MRGDSFGLDAASGFGAVGSQDATCSAPQHDKTL